MLQFYLELDHFAHTCVCEISAPRDLDNDSICSDSTRMNIGPRVHSSVPRGIKLSLFPPCVLTGSWAVSGISSKSK